MLKWIIILTLLLAIATAATAGVLLATSSGARDFVKSRWFPDVKTEVRLAPVEKGDLTRTVNAPGSVEPKTKVQISAQVAARIVALPFREGDAVKAGDVLVRLDARDLAAVVESAQAQLRGEQARLSGAQAALDQAVADHRRIEALFASRDVSQQQLDDATAARSRAQANLEATRHAIEVARAQITRAQKDLDNTVITAPFDGRIVKLNAEVGELVLVGTLNNAASVIMEVADLSTMLMKARVDEANIAPVQAGQRATVFINAFPKREFPGVVERVGLKRLVDRDGTGYFEVEVLLDRPDNLTLASGLTANADIAVETLRDVLKVPSQAIIDRRVDELPSSVRESPLVDRSRAFARVVYVIKDGLAHVLPVTVGSSDLTHTVITAGLEADRKIIVGPFKALQTLKKGDQVIDEVEAAAARAAASANSAKGAKSGKGSKSKTGEDAGDEEDDSPVETE